MNKRKIVLNLAMSLDGYIADNNGGFSWITGDGDNSHDTDKKMDFNDFLETVDTLIMGKKIQGLPKGNDRHVKKQKNICSNAFRNK